MNKKNVFSCYVIGDDTITLKCASIIMAGHHKLLGLISSSEKIKKWCETNSIPYIESVRQFEQTCEGEKFDFLFSIVNSAILSKQLLALPRHCAINYHNSPLPKYAGLYSTTWAILNGEKEHAISWHIMDESIDTGDILKQPTFPIDDNETALSLNLKCYEQAIHSFSELVDELAMNTIVPVKQSILCRSYYGLKDKPENSGFISWDKSAEEIDRLCRALTFGNYTNQLTVPKIMINGEIFTVKAHKKLKIFSGEQPGKIVNITSDHIQVATGTSDMAVLELGRLDGESLTIQQWVKKCHIDNTSQFDRPDSDFLLKFSNNLANLPKVEQFWINEFKNCAPEKASFLSKISKIKEIDDSIDLSKKMTLIPGKIQEKLKILTNTDVSLKTILLTASLIYLYRLNNYRALSIEFSDSKLRDQVSGLDKLLSDSIPLTVLLDRNMAFTEALGHVCKERQRLSKKKTFVKDIFIRYPEIKKFFSAIEIGITFTDVHKNAIYRNNNKLNVNFSENCDRFFFHTNTSNKLHSDLNNIFTNFNNHFLTLLNDISNIPDQKIFKLELLDKKVKSELMVSWNNTFHSMACPLTASSVMPVMRVISAGMGRPGSCNSL